jgi:hypothetical protein
MQTTKFIPQSVYDPAARCALIRACAVRGLPQVPLLDRHDRTMVLACFGPSLREQVDEIAATQGDLFTVSGAHDLLCSRGIIPKGHVESDPRPHKAKFLGNPHPDVTYFLASAACSEAFRALDGHSVMVWHAGSSVEEDALIGQLWPGAYITSGGTNVGMSAIALGSALGYRRFEVFGMDCSFESKHEVSLPADGPEQVRQHAAEHPNEETTIFRVMVNGRSFMTSGQLLQGVQDFISMRRLRPGFKVTLHGDGLLPTLIAAIDGGTLDLNLAHDKGTVTFH